MASIYEPVVILRADVVRIADTARVDSFVKIEGGEGVEIGEHVHIAAFCHVNIGGGRVVLEDGSAMASGAKVIGGSNQMAGVSMSAAAPAKEQVVRRYTTRIMRNAFLGTNSIVMPGVTIGEGAVIGAGAVVTKDVPPFEIWAGVPARKIGVRC